MKMVLVFLLSVFSFSTSAEQTTMIKANDAVIERLSALLKEKKFVPDPILFYPGAPTEDQRLICEQGMNIAIQTLIESGHEGLSEEQFWGLMKKAVQVYQQLDTEELERALIYVEEIMDIYDIESSDGRLMRWRYGFDMSDILD